VIYSVFFKLNTSIIQDEAVILTEVFTYSVHTEPKIYMVLADQIYA